MKRFDLGFSKRTKRLSSVSQRPTPRNMFKSLQFLFAVVILLAITVTFLKPDITGFVPTEVYGKNLNLMIDENSILTLDSAVPVSMHSLTVSGFVEGTGIIEIYLENVNGLKYLVYTNVREEKGLTSITGLATQAPSSEPLEGSLSIHLEELGQYYNSGQGGVGAEGNFAHQCLETCFLNPSEFVGREFKVYIFVEEGTSLNLNSLTYSAEMA